MSYVRKPLGIQNSINKLVNNTLTNDFGSDGVWQDAPIHAAMRADNLLDRGDLDGYGEEN